MVSNTAERSININAVGLPIDKVKLASFLWREELSLSSDLFYMQTCMDCLSYGHGYVVTVA